MMRRLLIVAAVVLALNVAAAGWVTVWLVTEMQQEAEARQQRRVEAIENAANDVIEELRKPTHEDGGIPTRQETFRAIRRMDTTVEALCRAVDGCEEGAEE